MMKWEEHKLGELITRLVDYRGKTPKKTSEGVKLLTAKVIKGGRILDNIEHEYIAEEDYVETMRRGIPQVNDIIVTTEAPLGEVAIITSDERIALAQRIILFTPDTDKVNPRFIYYSFFTTRIQERLYAKATGTTVPGISNPSLKSIKFPIPPLQIQERVAAILGRYDDLIANYQYQIAVLDVSARQIYREWFVRDRSPYVKDHAKLSKGWERRKVEECFEILGGGTPATEEPEYWEDGTINWYTPTDITSSEGIFLNESSEKITAAGLNNSSARLFPAYSVMMTSRATIGATAINVEAATTNQGFITCLANERFPYPFIYFWVLENKPTFEALASGATFLEITKSAFNQIELTVPPAPVLDSFQEMVLPIFRKIENLQSQVEVLGRMRNKLLPRLMSGLIPVTAS